MKHQQEWAEWKQKRFHTLKKWLRYLPTRASLKRHFLFQKFGRFFLDKYPELWSFAYGPMKSAYYAGWILTFMPVMGIQIPLAILLAVCFKANVMILIALQMISNPFTIGFLWPMEYHVGKLFLYLLPTQDQVLTQTTIAQTIAHTGRGASFVKATVAICLGGLILGLICAKISCIIHKRILKRTSLTYEQFVMLKEQKLATSKDAQNKE